MECGISEARMIAGLGSAWDRRTDGSRSIAINVDQVAAPSGLRSTDQRCTWNVSHVSYHKILLLMMINIFRPLLVLIASRHKGTVGVGYSFVCRRDGRVAGCTSRNSAAPPGSTSGLSLCSVHLFPASLSRFRCLIRDCSDDSFTFGPPGYTR